MCWNDAYLIIGMEDQYIGNFDNNSTQISSVAMYAGMVDMHALFPWPFKLLFHVYDAHAESQSYICLK